MDAEIAQLVRESRILEAAELASARGDARTASALFERACDWPSAAREALRAGDPSRALELGARRQDDETTELALAALARDPRAAEATAARLEHAGFDALAARAWEAAGRSAEAARAWERAGDALRAAAILEERGDVIRAARVLDAALRRDANAAPVAVALGALLARLGKDEAAVRCLQRVPQGAPARGDALPHLIAALARLGLLHASNEAAAELHTLGAAPRPNAAESAAPARARLFQLYETVREAASSPAARVLECVDETRGDRVAVKVFAAPAGLPDDALARVERDVRAMAPAVHPNIVPLRAFLPEGPALVTAWMDGGNLDDLRAAGPLSPARAAEIACALLAALGEAHRRGVVHRAVKPSNVLFDAAGTARLTDFGAAHWNDVSVTATAGVFGTLAYVSPEQREGQAPTALSDVYAVGALLREMLTGERPSAIAPPRVRPSEAHRGLGAAHDAVVDRLTATHPADRPASAFEAQRAIRAVPWPGEPRSGAVDPSEAGAPDAAAGRVRLVAAPGSFEIDTWTGRAVERVALSAPVLARARAFARAAHPALQEILRVDRDGHALWLAACPGEPLARSLAHAERERLEAALDALAAAGVAHGAVDRDHV
ncbi:MAG: protein kinase, partial [Polyangiaceae bacterium]|nr:protein kinase [Polyangiaceae bacterium]